MPNPLFFLKCPFPRPILSKSPFLAQTLPNRSFLLLISHESIFPQCIPMMAQHSFFLPISPFLTPTFPKEPNLASNLLFLLKCSFPTPIFCKSPILAQTLPKRTFLMPTFPEPIFPQYSPMIAQNPSFLPNSLFLTPTFPEKNPVLPQIPYFYSYVPFLHPFSLRALFWLKVYSREPFSCPLSLNPFFPRYSPIMAQKSLFSTQQSFSDTHCFQRVQFGPKYLISTRMSLSPPIFSEKFTLAQTLPKRSFLMPTFSEPIYSQYTLMMAKKNPLFYSVVPF